MKSVTFKIQGMHCDSCAESIKALVERTPGVQVASVTLDGGEARILYDPSATTVDRLAAIIERPGYRVVSRGA